MEQTCCPKEEIVQVESQLETETDFLLDKQARSQARLDICLACPELRALNNCRQCGCFMNIKTRIYSAVCPLGKW